MRVYYDTREKKEHVALVCGEIEQQEDVLLRIHSECFTGDVLGSVRCDCADQLHQSLSMIAEAKRGILIYLRQEGRGIGLVEKLKAYNLQEEGHDTVDANLMLGHQADIRNYDVAVTILGDLSPSSVYLLTNNPEKIKSLEDNGITISKRIALYPRQTNKRTKEYLRTKAERLHHLIDLDRF